MGTKVSGYAEKNAFCFFSNFNCGQASPEVVPTPARPPWCREHPQPGAARCSEPLCLSSTRLPVAPFHSCTEEPGPLLRALLLCGLEAAAVSVAQWWLGELQDGGSGFVEELGGTAQQPLGLIEGARQLLQPLCKLGVTLHRERNTHELGPVYPSANSIYKSVWSLKEDTSCLPALKPCFFLHVPCSVVRNSQSVLGSPSASLVSYLLP